MMERGDIDLRPIYGFLVMNLEVPAMQTGSGEQRLQQGLRVVSLFMPQYCRNPETLSVATAAKHRQHGREKLPLNGDPVMYILALPPSQGPE